MKRTRFALALAALFAAPVVAAPPPKTPTLPLTAKSQQQFNAALVAARKGDAVRAITLCRAALKESPNAAPVWATLARLLSETGYTADAIAAGRKAVALEPKDPAFVADLSDFLLRAGDSVAAEKTARRALSLHSRSDTALSVLVTCYLSQKRDADAIPLLVRLQAVRGGKDRAVAQNLIAARMRTGDTVGALAAAQEYAGRVSADPEALLAVVDLAAQSGNTVVAEKYLARLAKAAPLSPLPSYYRGRIALGETGKPLAARLAIAEASFQKSVGLAPGEALFHAELGAVLATQAGNLTGAARGAKLSDARTQLTAALLAENHHLPARRALAVVAEREANWLDAAAQYEALLKIAPNDNAARRRYAGVLLSVGRKPEGYAQFYELATRMPQDTLHLKELASFLMDDKIYAKARAAYGQILERAPNDPDALVGMGQAYAEDNKPPQARDAYRAAINADPARETPYLLLAQLYINDGETDAEAIATLEELLRALPGSQIGREQLIERYIAAKRDEDAKREIGKLVLRKNDPDRNRYLLALGNLYLVREKWADAIAEFERIAAQEPDNAAVLIALAGAYGKGERASDAATAYEKAATLSENALRKNSRNTDARSALVQARTAQNKRDAATVFLQTIEASPSGKQ